MVRGAGIRQGGLSIRDCRRCADNVKTNESESHKGVEMEGFKAVEMWYVRGIIGTYYETKLMAERAAWVAFPDEDSQTRYARVYYKTFFKEEN